MTPLFSDEHKKLFQISLDFIPFAVKVSKVPTGEIIMINRLGIELLGNPFVKGEPLIELLTVNGDSYPRDQLPAYLAIRYNKKVLKNDIYIKKDGKNNPFQVTAIPIKNSQNQPEFIFEIYENVLRAKDVERKKTDFISLASHQLRTPLAALRWFSEMLLSGDAGELNKEQREFVQNISDSAERMIELVNSLLNVSRIESGRLIIDPKPTNLSDLIGNVISAQKIKAEEKKINLIFDINISLAEINIDPKLIYEVYSHLISNAIKYTPAGGEVKIIVSEDQKNIISQVSDTGMGIPQEVQGKIFQKFFRADNAVKSVPDGNGLGLYLTKAIVESSGGEIWFNSVVGKGTSFYFSLPKEGSLAHAGEAALT